MGSVNRTIKRPWLAVTLSAIIPGLGHMYTGNFIKGLPLLGLNFLISYLNGPFVRQTMDKDIADEDKGVFWAYLVAGLLLTAFAMIDAKICADKINSGAEDDEA